MAFEDDSEPPASHARGLVFGPQRPMRLLYVEDSPLDAQLFLQSIKFLDSFAHINIQHVDTLSQACTNVAKGEVDCVLLDLGLPDGVGPANVLRLLEACPGLTIVVMTGDDDDSVGLQAIHHGAQEYLIKGQIEAAALSRILRHSVERNALLQELMALREREYFRATHDVLTGLPNRQLFEDRTRQSLNRAERNNESLALCYLDLDGFKPVNDSFGHAVGDALLCEVARCLTDAIRDGDTVARVGGDEFMLLLYPLADRQQAQRVASRVIERIHAIDSVDGQAVNISASVGISLYPEHAEGYADLTQYADIAMYYSKERQRGGYEYFNLGMLGESQSRRQMIAEIDEGLRAGRFICEFQPWVEAASGEIQGMETFLRWRTPVGEVRHPRLFLDAAQDSGQILKIARKTHEHSLRAWQTWRKQNLNPAPLAFNLSVRELADTHYLRELAELFDNLRLPRDQMYIHVEAQSLTRLAVHTMNLRFEYLRDLGFRLVLDGVSHNPACLELLENPAFSEIRIRANNLVGVTSADTDTLEDSQLQQLLAIAQRRGLPCVVVGVETAAQAMHLRKLGVRLIQGFHFAPPMATEKIPQLLHTGRIQH